MGFASGCGLLLLLLLPCDDLRREGGPLRVKRVGGCSSMSGVGLYVQCFQVETASSEQYVEYIIYSQ